MERLGDFELPDFFKDPSYFTLQPVGDARQAQIRAWKQLILDYCTSKRIYIVPVEDEFPLFSNPAIERSLSPEATEVFLSALVMEGHAEWTDLTQTKCLVLWRSIQDWANYILNFLNERGLESWVCTVEEVRFGDETRESELQGIDPGVLSRAVILLVQNGKARIIENYGIWFRTE
uniref:Uncharacterized protein n=1 Tax=Avena sativa TaxID=4498 RepID=A0ACD5YGI0_AVESA